MAMQSAAPFAIVPGGGAEAKKGMSTSDLGVDDHSQAGTGL